MQHNHMNNTEQIDTGYMPDYLKGLYERRMQVTQELKLASAALTAANVNYNAAILENIQINGLILEEERKLGWS